MIRILNCPLRSPRCRKCGPRKSRRAHRIRHRFRVYRNRRGAAHSVSVVVDAHLYIRHERACCWKRLSARRRAVLRVSWGRFDAQFCEQGRSSMLWPFVAGALRLTVTVSGATWLARCGAPLAWIFAPVTAGALLFGAVNVIGFSRTTKRLALSVNDKQKLITTRTRWRGAGAR